MSVIARHLATIGSAKAMRRPRTGAPVRVAPAIRDHAPAPPRHPPSCPAAPSRLPEMAARGESAEVVLFVL